MRYGLLGPLEVEAEGVALALGGPRQRAVLARLLVDAGRVVSTDALVDAVWGDQPPPTAVKTLQKYVVELRKTLGPGVVRTRGRAYFLDVADEEIDARCFEGLLQEARRAERAGDVGRAVALYAEADRLWRGPVLADFPDAAFVAPEHARLTELRLSALEAALDMELAVGDPVDVVTRAAQLVEVEPVRERLWASLILALYRSGRQVDALRAYERYRRLLADELGLQPSSALRALEVAVLRQDPELGGPAVARRGETAGNLPRPRTSLVGRAPDVAAVDAALASHPLVTLTGTGGIGKTRVAIEAATRVAGRHPGGCWFVDLAAVREAPMVPRAVADVLSVVEQPGEDVLDSLAGALSYRPETLVVLDNCEHLRDACADVVGRALLSAPRVRVLATSRRRLGIAGEHVIPLRPLAVEHPGDDGRRSAAVELFAERATEAAPGVELSDDDLAAAAIVCARLDGIPLAIELAACQVRILEPAEIATRLDDRLRFAATSTAGPVRQRTLEAAVAWSYELLSEPARAMFNRTAVFVESCTLEAAEAVAPPAVGRADVLGAISELVDGSLLTRERGPAAVARFRMLETLRVFGLAQLERGEAFAPAHHAHARFYLGLAEAAGWEHFGPAELTWKRRLRAEEPNLRAAIWWASQHERALAAQLCVALWPYWSMSWANAEGVAYLTPLLEEPGRLAPELRAWALTAAATLWSETGEARRSAVWADEAVRWFGEIGDDGGLCHARLAHGMALGNQGALDAAEAELAAVLADAGAAGNTLLVARTLEAYGLVADRRGDHEQARDRHLLEVDAWAEVGSVGGQAIGLFLLARATRSTGDLDAAVAISRQAIEAYTASDNPAAAAHPLSTIADVARLRGDDTAAERTYDEALVAFRANGDRRCVASTNKNLATIANRRGDHARATALLLDSMRLRQALGDEGGLAECLEGLATTALAKDELLPAVTLLAAGATLRAASGVKAPAEDQGAIEEVTRRVRAALDAEVFEEAWAAGAHLQPGAAVSYATGLVTHLRRPPRTPRGPTGGELRSG